MIVLRDPHQLTQVAQPEIKAFLRRRFHDICAPEPYDPDEHGFFILVEPGISFAICLTLSLSEYQSKTCANRYNRILLNARAISRFFCSFSRIDLEKLSVIIQILLWGFFLGKNKNILKGGFFIFLEI